MILDGSRRIRLEYNVVIITSDNKHRDERDNNKSIQVMLIKPSDDKSQFMWSIPGGEIATDKSLDDHVDEEVLNSTGLEKVYKEQLYTYDSGELKGLSCRVISVAYIALVSKEKITRSLDGEWFWVKVDRVNGKVENVSFINENTQEVVKELAFNHKQIVIDAMNRISDKIMDTDIGFQISSERFTLKELQSLFEEVSGKTIPSFRRIIESRITDTGMLTSDVKNKKDRFRPAHIYTKRVEE